MSLGALLLACLASTALSCASFRAPEASDLAHLPEKAPSPGAERWQAQVELDSERIAGHFTAIVVVQRAEELAFRVQILPEVGGKLLDLACNAQFLRGYFPHTTLQLDHGRSASTPPPRGLLSFLAASLAEGATPITRERVRGARQRGATLELDLKPALAGVDVRALYNEQGELIERCYLLRGVAWSERFTPDHVFESQGFRWRVLSETRESIADPPAALFHLELPEEPSP